MPHLPRRPARLDRRPGPGGQLVDQARSATGTVRSAGGSGAALAAHRRGGDDVPDELVDAVGGAEQVGGFGAPGGPLLGFGAGFVLGVPGLQGGLLGQLERLHRGRRAAVFGLERDRQGGPAHVDPRPPLGPDLGQLLGHTDDLADGPLAGGRGRVGVGAGLERHPEPPVQLGLDAGVVPLGRGDGGLEQHPGVQGQPPAGGAVRGPDADLVGDRDVGVQVRVAGAGVAVVERRGEQAGGVQLLHPVAARRGCSAASRSSQPRTSATAAWCAAVICSATCRGAIAHSADTDLTGVNVRSNPAIALVVERELRAMNEDSSRGSFGVPAVGLGEHLPAHLGADPGPLRGRQRPCPGRHRWRR